MRWGCEKVQVNYKGTEFKIVKVRYKEDLESWIAENPAKRRQLDCEIPFDRNLKNKARSSGASIGVPVRITVEKGGKYA